MNRLVGTVAMAMGTLSLVVPATLLCPQPDAMPSHCQMAEIASVSDESHCDTPSQSVDDCCSLHPVPKAHVVTPGHVGDPVVVAVSERQTDLEEPNLPVHHTHSAGTNYPTDGRLYSFNSVYLL